MVITLVRHGEVDEKYHKCYNGHIDISLSQKGVEDAKLLGEKLQEKQFDAIYCSDLKRAKETLLAFAPLTLQNNKHSWSNENILFTDKLREKSWGKHEGLSFDAVIAQGEIEYKNFLQWVNALGGENYQEYIQRVQEFFFTFLPQQNKHNVLVVTHAGVIRVLIAIVQELSLEDAFCINIPYASRIIYNTQNATFEYL